MFAMPMRIVMPIPVAVMILTLRHQREHRPGSVRARDKALREAFYSCCRLFGGANRVCRLAVGVTAARERCADSVG